MFHHSDALINHLLHGNNIGGAISCPHENKISSIIYLVKGLNTYPISKEAKETERNTIKITLHNNKYNNNKIILHPAPPQQKKKKNTDTGPQHQKKKLSTFT
jgi:hypothetical protein